MIKKSKEGVLQKNKILKNLHPKDNIDIFYRTRKSGWKGLVDIDNGGNATIQGLEEYIKMSKEKLI